MLAKAVEVAGPGAAGVDEGGDAASPRQQLGRHAKRGAAPIDVRVQVDQAGRDELALDLARLASREVVADRRDLAAGESDVGHLVDPLRRIDQLAALQHQIVHAFLIEARHRVRRR